MRGLFAFAAVAAAGLFASPVAAQVVTANSSGPTTPINGNATNNTGWGYGSGNNYQPSNTLLADYGGGNQLALRLHETYQPAPASDASGVYSFALGTSNVSYDWDIGSWNSGYDYAMLTITNLLTGATYSYNPQCPLGPGNSCANDNFVYGYTTQNSNRLNYLPVGFNPNVNDTYSVNLSTYFGGRLQESLTAYAKLGSGYAGLQAAVPEPATWAMMLLGFGAIGLTMRRKRAAEFVAA